jgi:hypothetical protein
MEPPAALLKDAHIDVDGDGLFSRTPNAPHKRVAGGGDRLAVPSCGHCTIEVLTDTALELRRLAKERLEKEPPRVPNVGPLSVHKFAIHPRPSIQACCVPAYMRP